MIDNDNEKRTKVWKSTFFELTSDIQVTNPNSSCVRSASYSASIIILFSRYRLCKNIFTRVCLYIYILNCFVICLAHGERPLQHVESRLTVGKTLHREDNRDSKGCVSPKQAVFMHLYFTTYVYFIHISLIHIYIWNNPRFWSHQVYTYMYYTVL